MTPASLQAQTNREAWTMGTPHNGYPPMKMSSNDPEGRRGFINDLSLEILDRAGIDLDFLTIPSRRNWTLFLAGNLDTMGLVDPLWLSPVRKASLLLSAPVMTNRQVIVQRSVDPAIPFGAKLSSLNGKIVATIPGYNYRGSDGWVRSDSRDQLSALRKVILARADAAIMDERVARWLIHTHKLEGLKLGPVFTDSVLQFAIHRKHEDRLPEINTIIKAMHREGQITRLIQAYIPDYTPSPLPEKQAVAPLNISSADFPGL